MAVKDYATLQADIATRINDNTAQEISEQDVRASFQDTVDSAWTRWRSRAWTVGELCWHPTDHRLIECNTANSDAAFDAGKWDNFTGGTPTTTFTVTVNATGGNAAANPATVESGQNTIIVADDGFQVTATDAGTLRNGIVYLDNVTADTTVNVTVAAVTTGDDARVFRAAVVNSASRTTAPTPANVSATSWGVGSVVYRDVDTGVSTIRQRWIADSTTTTPSAPDEEILGDINGDDTQTAFQLIAAAGYVASAANLGDQITITGVTPDEQAGVYESVEFPATSGTYVWRQTEIAGGAGGGAGVTTIVGLTDTPATIENDHYLIGDAGSFINVQGTLISRNNLVEDVEPTALEHPTPSRKDTARVFLNQTVMEIWSFDTTWTKTHVLRGVGTSGTAPTLSNPGSQTNVEGDTVALTIGNSGGAITTIDSVTGLPSGLSAAINAGGGIDITGTIAAGEAGSSPFSVSITTSNSAGQDTSAPLTFVWNVSVAGSIVEKARWNANDTANIATAADLVTNWGNELNPGTFDLVADATDGGPAYAGAGDVQLDGVSVVRFNLAGFMTALWNDMAAGDPFTIALAVQVNTATNTQGSGMIYNDPDEAIGFQHRNTGVFQQGTNTQNINVPRDLNWHVFVLVFDGAQSALYQDGVKTTGTTPNAAITPSGFRMGANQSGATKARDTNVAYAAFFEGAADDTEAAQIRTDIKAIFPSLP